MRKIIYTCLNDFRILNYGFSENVEKLIECAKEELKGSGLFFA